MGEQSGFQVVGSAAELYERYAVRYFIGRWAPGLVASAALRPGERVLDLACGPSAMIVQLPSVEEFVLGHLAGTPVAGAVTALDDEKRTALARQVKMALQPYAKGDGVEVPDEANIAIAYK